MKLVNFASLDPVQQARGVRGLANHSPADRQVWDEFQSNWEQMSLISETALEALQIPRGRDAALVEQRSFEDAITEVESLAKIRTMQGFFRRVVLAAYDSTCCLTGNPASELLVASHILPWSRFPKERLNPRNGLCLAAHYDRAFDRGLVTLDETLRLVLSPTVKRYLPNEALEMEFVQREGQPLRLPDRFAPDPEFIAHHRSQIFHAQ